MHVGTVFELYDGTGKWFDLSKTPFERKFFSFGGSEMIEERHEITDACILPGGWISE